MRHAISALSEQRQIPIENLITPEVVRRILWEPPQAEAELSQMLDEFSVRQWQRDLIEPILRQAIFEPLISTEPAPVIEQ